MRHSQREPACSSRMLGFGFWVSGVGFRISGFGIWDSGFGFRVHGFGFRLRGQLRVPSVGLGFDIRLGRISTAGSIRACMSDWTLGCRSGDQGVSVVQVTGHSLRRGQPEAACPLRISGFGFWLSGFWFRASGFEFLVSGFRFRVSGIGFVVSVSEYRDGLRFGG